MFKDILKFSAQMAIIIPCKTIVATAGTVRFVANVVGSDQIAFTALAVKTLAKQSDYLVKAIDKL